MRRGVLFFTIVSTVFCATAFAGEVEIKSAQGAIEGQLKAFQAGDSATAYSFAAPNVKQIFPTVEAFTGMVSSGYAPVYKPQNFAFGKVEEMGTRIAQQVMIVGPDGKDYEALYTLELQPDGKFRITGVSLRASSSLTT